ncbi:phosphoribosylamine--glycine ligase [Peptostreptococcus canis]|uniref:Phosphoribosylamine--glycine ligase n=1 Tax=Peptostreptococcus canis TaxID=1159213 RepID=A0ABR6TLD8_9FIRM|nr:phosphoribosylamine--glycine ligase [Peptostreptococcus canis]MBC2576212.1 phosphoribosylamine--glycine ligase [Peptostreptococcus canis]MBP1998253.1 phosphoribosylamine--glycine ligase [Peptostreptococcus canis]
MKVLVVGGGGREHAICWKLNGEKNVEKIYCAPGNAGIADVAECVDIKDTELEKLADFAIQNKIDLTVVGPEVPLVMGISDLFASKGLRVFGPDKSCSRLEGSKLFSKEFMVRHNIPTAKYKEYTDINKAIDEIDSFGYPVVIKADGLAAGKGVIIPTNRKEAIDTLNMIMRDKKFGDSGNLVVVEEFLTGIETSILAFVDKNTIIPMESAKDHKKIYELETGPNTGGMGTFSPSTIYNDELAKKVYDEVLMKSLKGFQEDGLEFRGILFVGLMITPEGEKVLEYNCRFGDPETQSVLMRLDSELSEIMLAITEDRLGEVEINYSNDAAACVVLASGGYPEEYEKGKAIRGLEDVDDSIVVFHSGTKLSNGEIVTNGGRVLGVCSRGKDVEAAAKNVYKNIEKISFEGMHYRKDIGVNYEQGK